METSLNACYSGIDLLETWHKRLVHVNYGSMNKMYSSELVEGLPAIIKLVKLCDVCQYDKQCRKPFPKETVLKAYQKLNLVHTDIYGPMKTLSLNNSKYYKLFIDDLTRYCWTFFIKQKLEALIK